MPRLKFDCEELLHWWEPKSDISFIFNFNWHSLHELRDAITIFLSARLAATAQRARQEIMESSCTDLQRVMASNPKTPADLLAYLCEIGNEQILTRVAENPNCSKETLLKLTFNESADVRAAVADNENTPEACFKRLVHDQSADVRFRVAENPHAPLSSLYTLLKDENPFVCARAKETLSRILCHTIAVAQRAASSQSQLSAQLPREKQELLSRHVYENWQHAAGVDFVAVEISTRQLPPV